MLSQLTAHFSDGTKLVLCSRPPPEPRRAVSALLKTCNQLHGMSEPSAAAWELASPSQRLSGHVSHHAGWPVSLMSKGSEGACTPSGVSTFLLTAFMPQ